MSQAVLINQMQYITSRSSVWWEKPIRNRNQIRNYRRKLCYGHKEEEETKGVQKEMRLYGEGDNWA